VRPRIQYSFPNSVTRFLSTMSSFAPRERLQPSLLDRFSDDEPRKKSEGTASQIISLDRLRGLIMRDLTWLLNCDNMDCVIDLTDYPEVASSVLNYGLHSFAGSTLSTANSVDFEQIVRKAILTFEPRIQPGTLVVKSVIGDSMGEGHKTVSLEIEGQIWAQPFTLEFLLRSDLDLETGSVILKQVT
jgi:type VI secretion system protein ImpF